MKSMFELDLKKKKKIDSKQILQSIPAKLPLYSGVKWCRFAHEVQSVSSKSLANFVKQEAELVNDPIFSPDVLEREKKRKSPAGDNRSSKSRPQGRS